MKTSATQTRLENLIKSDTAAGRKVKWLEIDAKDTANLINEIGKEKSPLSKAMKKSGVEVALPTLDGVSLRWRAAVTKTGMQ